MQHRRSAIKDYRASARSIIFGAMCNQLRQTHANVFTYLII